MYGGVYRCNTVDTGFRSVGLSWKEGSATVRMAHRRRRAVRLVPARSGRRGVLRGDLLFLLVGLYYYDVWNVTRDCAIEHECTSPWLDG